MPTLKVGKIKCLVETSEAWSDDIYLVVFIGRKPNPLNCELKVIGPAGFWEDMDSGEEREVDVTIDSQYSSSNLYFIGMMEQDDGTDFTGADKTKLKNWIAPVYSAWASVGGLSDVMLNAQISVGMLMGLVKCRTNDDVVGIPQRVKFPSGKKVQWVDYIGDGGAYQVGFKLT